MKPSSIVFLISSYGCGLISLLMSYTGRYDAVIGWALVGILLFLYSREDKL